MAGKTKFIPGKLYSSPEKFHSIAGNVYCWKESREIAEQVGTRFDLEPGAVLMLVGSVPSHIDPDWAICLYGEQLVLARWRYLEELK